MEDIKQFIFTEWPIMVQYFLMFAAYFLVFLFRGKVNATKLNLTTAFKENLDTVSHTEKRLRSDVRTELEESKANYKKAVDKIKSLENELVHLKNAMCILIGEDYEEVCGITDEIGTEHRRAI